MNVVHLVLGCSRCAARPNMNKVHLFIGACLRRIRTRVRTPPDRSGALVGAGRKALDRGMDAADSGRMTSKNPGAVPDIRPAQLKEQPTAVVRETVPMNALRDFFGRAFGAVTGAVQQQHVQLAGPPFALYRGRPTDVVDVEAGFPLAAPFTNPGGEDTEVIAGTLPAGRAYEAMHVGPVRITAADLWRDHGTDAGGWREPGGSNVGVLPHRSRRRTRPCEMADVGGLAGRLNCPSDQRRRGPGRAGFPRPDPTHCV